MPILNTDKYTMTLRKRRDKGAPFRKDGHRFIASRSRCLYQGMPANTKVTVTKTKNALKQESYNRSDLKHDPHCGFVELGDSVSVS